jgi:hypothetical protein
VISFGADPTGVKDSAAAVRAAVASIGPVAATLYFPKGTYRFASYGLMPEECVRITASLSLMGDGPGQTIFTDDATGVCGAQFGFFWSMQNSTRNDYSFESDPGYPVGASTAGLGSTTIRLTGASDPSRYAVGQYVFLRGNALPQTGEYHGELNLVTAVNSSTGVITLGWPLSSSFIQDTGLQLNLVANTEVLANIQISGITFNFHNSALLAAQIRGLKIFNNEFTYIGSSAGWQVSQFNQLQNVEFNNNIVNNPQGPALDVERTSNSWDIHDNVMYGWFDAGEGGSNMHFHNNTITCVGLQFCIRVSTTGNMIDHNQVYSSCPTDSCHAVTDVTPPFMSVNTVITYNYVSADGPRNICRKSRNRRLRKHNLNALYRE